MNKLEFRLDKLITFLNGLATPAPAWSRIAIVDQAAIRPGKIAEIPRAALSTPEDYASIFEDYLGRGYHWINLNTFGIMEDTLLIIVELPNYTSPIIGKTSVNLSGPAILHGEIQWDASERVKIIEK
jgi:hypothetical protein